MRTALLLPLTTVVASVAVSIGLATPATQPVRPGSARVDATTVAAPSVSGSRLGGPSRARLESPVPPAPRSPTVLRGRWSWPLSPQPAVARPFVRPATAYGAGHRGIDLAGSTGQEVRAVEAGTVSHVGRLAGRGTVTVLHGSGVRSTYEPVQGLVSTGDVVARG